LFGLAQAKAQASAADGIES